MGSVRRPASPRPNSEAMPCAIDQRCRLIIIAGGRWLTGRPATSVSAAPRSTAHPRRARGVGEGEAPRAFFLDQLARRLDQRFAQIAVVVGPLARATFPAHVKGVYIRPSLGASTTLMPKARRSELPWVLGH